MTKGEFAFQMFGHSYAFGDGTSPVYVVGMLFEESFVKSLPNFSGPNQGGTSFKLYALNFDLPPSAWPQFVRYLDEYDVQVPLNYNRTPGAEDVPAGSGLPQQGVDGYWDDPSNRVNGVWNSTSDDVITVDAVINGQRRTSVRVKFNNGYPDFTPWKIGEVTLEPLQRTNGDFITYKSLCSNRAIELFITNLAPRCGVSCRSWPTASTTD